MTNFWERIRSPEGKEEDCLQNPSGLKEFKSYRESEIPLPNEQENLTGFVSCREEMR